MAATIKLYHAAHTRSHRVLWLLEELGLAYELETVEFTPENLQKPEFLALHPLGRLPVMIDGDLLLFESGAMVEYLLERYGQGRLMPAAGTPEKAVFLQWLHFAEATMMPPISDIAQNSMIKPEEKRIPAVVMEAFEKVGTNAAALDKCLAGKTYLCGDSFTGADVMMGYTLYIMGLMGQVGDQVPSVKAYYDRLAARPAFQKAFAE